MRTLFAGENIIIGYVHAGHCTECFQWHFVALDSDWSEVGDCPELGFDYFDDALMCLLESTKVLVA